MAKLTKRLIESTLSQDKDVVLWDNEVKGFCCKITPAGKRVYLLYYRTHDGRQRKPKIGDHGVMTCEEARTIAQRWLSDISQGGDPSAQKSLTKNLPTIKELAERYIREYAPRKKEASRKDDERLWNHYVLPFMGERKISTVTRQDVISLHHSLKHFPIRANRVLRGCLVSSIYDK